jgi:TPR repeat protein
LASRLSRRLGGFPVQGQDGFVWLSSTGKIRTTHQAFTLVSGGYARIKKGADVFVSLTTAGAVRFEDKFIASRNGAGMVDAGMAWDVFSLCPEKALDRFLAAAGFGNNIGAYNAALLLLDRGSPSDSLAARKWLQQAAQRGDTLSRNLLSQL